MIERMVDFHADLEEVWVTYQGREVARHKRSWAKKEIITDPAHVEKAARLRAQFQTEQRRPKASVAAIQVATRALSAYDDLCATNGLDTRVGVPR